MPIFDVNDLVVDRNQPQLMGVVVGVHFNEQMERHDYRVQFGAQIRAVPETSLRAFNRVETGWEAFLDDRFSDTNFFRETITFHRLRSPSTRIANAFSSARTQFFPHQFKPLLKFVENQSRGLLIADDVGLGKTIEAGYILQELRARQNIDRVAVIAPARLGTKWKYEMRTRFGMDFEVVQGRHFIDLANRIQEGEPDPFRWIVSYESVRPPEVREAIENSPLTIDVLIVDECHRMRNPETLQHQIGAAMAEIADFCIFLSATPVQNRIDDLWNVLKLLSPSEFFDQRIFDQQMNVHRFVMNAQSFLSSNPPALGKARDALRELVDQNDGRIVPADLVESFCAQLERTDLTAQEVREIRKDVTQISPVGSIISRTRKADAMPGRAIRVAHWCPIDLSPEEQNVYAGVEIMCRELWPNAENNWGFRMTLLSAYRMTASSIPAAVRYFREKLQNRVAEDGWDGWIEEAPVHEAAGQHAELDLWTGESRVRFEEIVANWQEEGGTDTKFNEVRGAIENIWEEDHGADRIERKIVLFSYYRRTLEYLAERFLVAEIDCRMIHGGIAVPERERRIDEFLENENIKVLLTSEVGGEGIDLQKASVVINYDLPWNPMVVEQRIGRIDRIGQEAERLIIANLIIRGSVEEIVLQRLLNRINIFESSIGELDAIIGDRVERLAESAISGRLTPDEISERVEQEGNALQNSIDAARAILAREENLLAADQDLLHEINAVVGNRLIPTENDLLSFLNSTFAGEFPGLQLSDAVTDSEAEVDFRGQCLRELAGQQYGNIDGINRFRERASNGPLSVTLSRDVAYRHSRSELLHIRHPLIRLAISLRERQLQRVAFSIEIDANDHIGPGQYMFSIFNVEFNTNIRHRKMIAIAVNMNDRTVWSDSENVDGLLRTLIENGRNWMPNGQIIENIDQIKELVIKEQDRVVARICARESSQANFRFQRQRAARLATARIRVENVSNRLVRLRMSNAGAFPIRMAKAQLQRANDAYKQIEAEQAPQDQVDYNAIDEIAVGRLNVTLINGNGKFGTTR